MVCFANETGDRVVEQVERGASEIGDEERVNLHALRFGAEGVASFGGAGGGSSGLSS